MINAMEAGFGQATAFVRDVRRPLLVSHAKPDGDAIGSLVAMRAVLRVLGAEPFALVYDDIPDRYCFLVDDEPLTRLGADLSLADLDRRGFDGVVVLDTCTYNQLEPIADWLRATSLRKLVVDHHVTRDELADVSVIDESAAAACLVLHEWFESACFEIDAAAAQALYVGIATDTGWFRHSNTDARAMSAATKLVARGVRPSAMFDLLFQQETVARFRLRAAVGSHLELLADDRLAVQAIPARVFDETGSSLAETEDLVNEPLRVSGTVLSVMLVDQGGGVTRVGFRSRAPITEDDPDIDVAAIAMQFGGGGHRRAAGARIQAPLDEAKSRVVEAMVAALGVS